MDKASAPLSTAVGDINSVASTDAATPKTHAFERSQRPFDPPSPAKNTTGASWIEARVHTPASEVLAPLLADTWRGITERLITARGLPIDRLVFAPNGDLESRSPATSPTNMGLYLAAIVVQRDRGAICATEAITRAAATLEAIALLEKDARGFLFNWYDAETTAKKPPFFVSSVDNGNLMIVLEGLKHAFADQPQLVSAADTLLAPMKRSFADAFLERDPSSDALGCIRLGYQVGDDGDEGPTPHHYDRFGSEARSIVALLEADGHLPKGSLARLAKRTTFATQGAARTFKTWDGGVFQWLLPNVLLGETSLSAEMERQLKSLATILVALGPHGFPLASSACDLPDGRYEGKSGIPFLAEDAEYIYGGVLTPHALFLLSSVAPEIAARALAHLCVEYPEIYRKGVGFMDSVELATGNVGRSVLALDQLMSLIGSGDFARHVQAQIPLEATYASIDLGG